MEIVGNRWKSLGIVRNRDKHTLVDFENEQNSCIDVALGSADSLQFGELKERISRLIAYGLRFERVRSMSTHRVRTG